MSNIRNFKKIIRVCFVFFSVRINRKLTSGSTTWPLCIWIRFALDRGNKGFQCIWKVLLFTCYLSYQWNMNSFLFHKLKNVVFCLFKMLLHSDQWKWSSGPTTTRLISTALKELEMNSAIYFITCFWKHCATFLINKSLILFHTSDINLVNQEQHNSLFCEHFLE